MDHAYMRGGSNNLLYIYMAYARVCNHILFNRNMDKLYN